MSFMNVTFLYLRGMKLGRRGNCRVTGWWGGGGVSVCVIVLYCSNTKTLSRTCVCHGEGDEDTLLQGTSLAQHPTTHTVIVPTTGISCQCCSYMIFPMLLRGLL
jgi:hypothetical protein